MDVVLALSCHWFGPDVPVAQIETKLARENSKVGSS